MVVSGVVYARLSFSVHVHLFPSHFMTEAIEPLHAYRSTWLLDRVVDAKDLFSFTILFMNKPKKVQQFNMNGIMEERAEKLHLDRRQKLEIG